MKTILITGASSGIGRATANYFSERGWNVVATMRSPEKETELNRLDCVLVTKLDVERKATIQDAITKGIEHFGKIDVLLNNAGYAAFGPFEAATDVQVKKQFDVNVFGVMNSTKAILPHFRTNKAGMIINLSSIGGRVAFPLISLYHASKWAIEGFSESLYYELATQNIKVKVIEPGNIATDFTGRSLELIMDESLEVYKTYHEKVLQKQMESFQTNVSTPELVAKVIYEAAIDQTERFRYLAGEDAKFLENKRKESSDDEFMKFITSNFR
ncbi:MULTISPECIES: SDR family oxidoreductase [Bacillus]|uniref:Short-chain dehydrogenase n=2 Tax=Bacillus TaxID=1386 RepID=A0A0M4FSU7_9BACI|nr:MULTISPECIES: SDR family oxidoreductase [Bacillus]ALC82960.1 short-chain dehydrogenase [Bacillus gobiensis]MBP1081957.1 NAD(P)-dependent dehydrogenase (short-subunit alcohol dehydrogenase family) [Bacillus capparidis]MED1096601.1 SDR family oxidoreductase [Bacillus capparidis]